MKMFRMSLWTRGHPGHEGCPGDSVWRHPEAGWPQGPWGQAGLCPRARPWGSAPRPGWAASSGCRVCRPQVPIIPVVYSSFSSFYSCKTKLFTSGSPPPPYTHTLVHTQARPPDLP